MKYSLVLAMSTALLVSSKLIVDYTGGQDASVLGNVELEGQELGCHITNGQAGNSVFVKAEPDSSNGIPSLHLKRDPHFRRAEVKAMANSSNKPQINKTYYIGYNFRLSGVHESLVIFQWKKGDKVAAPAQNIPLYVHFGNGNTLNIEYTIPGGSGSNREVVWSGPVSSGVGTNNKLGFIINTKNDGTGWLEFYLNGAQQKFNSAWGGGTRLSNVYLFTGDTSPKFGIYRAELAAGSGDGSKYCPSNGVFTGAQAAAGSDRIFNAWIYRVQISDTSKAEAAAAAGW